MTQAFFSDNGSTAVEAALKLSLQYWSQTTNTRKKKRFLSLEHAFHGETMGATALCGVKAFVAPFESVGLSVSRLPSPAEDLLAAIEALQDELVQHGDEIAALVVEPLIQGAGGMLIYEPAYLREARRLCSEYNVLLIVDEVFTGYGRTGSFWACDHAQVSPDILCTAKGLSGGMLPFAATLVSEKVFEAFLGAPDRAFYYGHTYCGNPLGASVAAEVLSIYKDEDIVAGTKERSGLIAQAFERLSALPGVENPRSLGMCGAVNLSGGKGYLERGGWQVYEKALQRGVYVRPLGNVVYVTPPLNIPLSDLSELLFVVEECVGEVALEAQTR
jgi:adenosylmethionine-8-amino-7-oxononanoate aminotransferase